MGLDGAKLCGIFDYPVGFYHIRDYLYIGSLVFGFTLAEPIDN